MQTVYQTSVSSTSAHLANLKCQDASEAWKMLNELYLSTKNATLFKSKF